MIKNKELKRRIIEISYMHKLSHIASCLTAVDIIVEIYKNKRKDEPFVLSSGHAGLALYVVIEKYYGKNAEEIFNHHGVHPDRCMECHLDCSTGSLGQGLPIALGMALADRRKKVYCLISDGEANEGSIYEALRIKREQKVDNLHVYLNFNGWGAYGKIEVPFGGGMPADIHLCDTRDTIKEIGLTFLEGQAGHYHIMNEEDYNLANKILL